MATADDFWAIGRARMHGYGMGYDDALEILEAERSQRLKLGHSRHVRHLDESIRLLRTNHPKLRSC